ncbi:hypothetical protein GCM10010206_12330 [Streptomyces cinerochromogenes]|nr:hypothetical protein GCM10010206_12330 [Streptomyces cinerochromogenes]
MGFGNELSQRLAYGAAGVVEALFGLSEVATTQSGLAPVHQRTHVFLMGRRELGCQCRRIYRAFEVDDGLGLVDLVRFAFKCLREACDHRLIHYLTLNRFGEID